MADAAVRDLGSEIWAAIMAWEHVITDGFNGEELELTVALHNFDQGCWGDGTPRPG